MFGRIFCFLAVYLLQVNANHDWSYCTCMNDVNAAKLNYENRHDDYFNTVMPTRNRWDDGIEDRVNQMHTRNECHNAYYTKSVREFTWEIIAICGGHALGNTYEPQWRKDPEMTNEEVCSTIATMGPIMCEYIELNYSVLDGCEVSNTFDKYIWPNYEECAKNKCKKN